MLLCPIRSYLAAACCGCYLLLNTPEKSLLHPHAKPFFYSRSLQLNSPILSSSPGWANTSYQLLLGFNLLQLPAKWPFSGLFPVWRYMSYIGEPQAGPRCSSQELSRSSTPLAFLAMPSVKAALYSAPLPRPILQSYKPDSLSPAGTATRDVSVLGAAVGILLCWR